MIFDKASPRRLTVEKLPGREATEKIAAATREVIPFFRRHLVLSISLLLVGLVLIGVGVYFLLKILPNEE